MWAESLAVVTSLMQRRGAVQAVMSRREAGPTICIFRRGRGRGQ